MIEDKKINSISTNTIQNIILESRKKLSISGVLDVLSFDDQIVILETELRIINNKRRKLAYKQVKHRYIWGYYRRRNSKFNIF